MENNSNNEIFFFQAMGIVFDLHKFGSIIVVIGDENCGYHPFLLGLIDIDENNIRTLTHLLLSLYEHGKLAFLLVKNSMI